MEYIFVIKYNLYHPEVYQNGLLMRNITKYKTVNINKKWIMGNGSDNINFINSK